MRTFIFGILSKCVEHGETYFLEYGRIDDEVHGDDGERDHGGKNGCELNNRESSRTSVILG